MNVLHSFKAKISYSTEHTVIWPVIMYSKKCIFGCSLVYRNIVFLIQSWGGSTYCKICWIHTLLTIMVLHLSAAIDTVNNQILLSPLSEFDISGTALSWLKSYLSGRTLKVTWQGQVSNSHCLSSGVLKGSVFTPLLFSIHMSLGSIIHWHSFSYHCYTNEMQLF